MIVVICEVVDGTTEGPPIGIPDGLSNGCNEDSSD